MGSSGMQLKYPLDDGRWVKEDTIQINIENPKDSLDWSDDLNNKDLVLIESIKEVIVSIILRNSNLYELGFDYVDYKMYKHNSCISDDFLDNRVEYTMRTIINRHREITGDSMALSSFGRVEEKIRNLLGVVTAEPYNIDEKEFLKYLVVISELDYIIENPDRHFGNFGLMKNLRTNKFEFLPIFDNGYAIQMEDIFDEDGKILYSGSIPINNTLPFTTTPTNFRSIAREMYFGDKDRSLLLIDINKAISECEYAIYNSEYHSKIKGKLYDKVLDILYKHSIEGM